VCVVTLLNLDLNIEYLHHPELKNNHEIGKFQGKLLRLQVVVLHRVLVLLAVVSC